MKRFLISVLSAGTLFSIACSNNTSTIMSPTASSADIALTSGAEPVVEKYYTVGGVVQSVEKPFFAIEGARIEAVGSGNEGRSTVSGPGGSFSMPLRSGNLTLIVTMAGYEPWSTKVALYNHQPDLNPMLMPRR